MDTDLYPGIIDSLVPQVFRVMGMGCAACVEVGASAANAAVAASPSDSADLLSMLCTLIPQSWS
jgi:predicted naringenin-chalcone synthase